MVKVCKAAAGIIAALVFLFLFYLFYRHFPNLMVELVGRIFR